MQINPSEIAKTYRDAISEEIKKCQLTLQLVGFLTEGDVASKTYAEYTQRACAKVGVSFEIREIQANQLEDALNQANEDQDVCGILIYYPIYGDHRDHAFTDRIIPEKDIEGLSQFWTQKLYANERFAIRGNDESKAIVPCTSLAIIKLLDAAGASHLDAAHPYANKNVAIFNRSPVVGEPLAAMMANDGATVYSFDIEGVMLFKEGHSKSCQISRADAIKTADVVITGVPNPNFEQIHCHEIKPGAICLNFSSIENFASDIEESAGVYIPRVGPMTVAIFLRNTLRLYNTYHSR